MAENKRMYPYSFIYKEKTIILIWQENDKFEDSFKLNIRKKLISSTSLEQLKSLLGSSVKWEQGTEINIDKFWVSLNNLRLNRASSERTCQTLLDGWNFVEDLLNIFSLEDAKKRLKSPLLNKRVVSR